MDPVSKIETVRSTSLVQATESNQTSKTKLELKSSSSVKNEQIQKPHSFVQLSESVLSVPKIGANSKELIKSSLTAPCIFLDKKGREILNLFKLAIQISAFNKQKLDHIICEAKERIRDSKKN